MSFISQFEVDGQIVSLEEVTKLAEQSRLVTLGTSHINTGIGVHIIVTHYKTKDFNLAGGITSFTKPKTINYKQRFNKKVAMA